MQLNLAGVIEAIRNIQRDIATGAKSYSVLMNINDSASDTYSIRQSEFFVAAIASIQEEAAAVFNDFFDVGNQVQGIPSESAFYFLKQRVLDKKHIAETEKIEIENIEKALDRNWITEEEAKEQYRLLRDPRII